MSRILIACTGVGYDPAIIVQEYPSALFVFFGVGPLVSSQEADRTEIWYVVVCEVI
jgi:hypothetical protein